MFLFDTNIEFIDFEQYNEIPEIMLDNVLGGIRENIVVCIKEDTNNVDKFKEKIMEKKCYTIYCGDDWRDHIKKYIPETNSCADDCLRYRYEYDNKCYSVCPDGVVCIEHPVPTENIASSENLEKTNEISFDSSSQNEHKSDDIINPSSSNVNVENTWSIETEEIIHYNITGQNNQKIYLEVKEIMSDFKASKKEEIVIQGIFMK